MTTKKQGQGGKGFDGLESLLSGSDRPDRQAKTQETTEELQTAWEEEQSNSSSESAPDQSASSNPTPPSSPSTLPPNNRPPPISGSEPNNPGKSYIGRVLAGVAVIIFLAIVIDDPPSKSPSKEGPNTNRVAQPQVSNSKPKAPEASSAASKPPVGTNQLLSQNQIQYCLAEEIRLTAMKDWINNNIDLEVEHFNKYINDFNSRCGSYRYREGTLSSARRTVSGIEKQLTQEGKNRVQSWRQEKTLNRSVVSTTPKPKPRPSQIVREVQRILTSLGYETGPVDGLNGFKTTSAVRQFQKDYGFRIDIFINMLYLQIYVVCQSSPMNLPLPRDVFSQHNIGFGFEREVDLYQSEALMQSRTCFWRKRF